METYKYPADPCRPKDCAKLLTQLVASLDTLEARAKECSDAECLAVVGEPRAEVAKWFTARLMQQRAQCPRDVVSQMRVLAEDDQLSADGLD